MTLIFILFNASSIFVLLRNKIFQTIFQQSDISFVSQKSNLKRISSSMKNVKDVRYARAKYIVTYMH